MVRHEGMSTSQAVSTFAAFRPPGIYKDSYIDQLFKYNHEDRQGLKSIAWSISGRCDLEPTSIQSLQFLICMLGGSFWELMTSSLMLQATQHGDSPGTGLEVGGWA